MENNIMHVLPHWDEEYYDLCNKYNFLACLSNINLKYLMHKHFEEIINTIK